jgi:hypothetical protein
VTRRRALVVAALVAVTAISTALRAVVPIWVLADPVEDDLLFVRLGTSLREGDWLGPYSFRTLQKGPGFPAFLAVVHQTHLPYLVAVHLVHLLACAAAAAAIGRATGSRRLGCWIYVVLALDPSYFGWGASRVLRDDWYSSLSLLLFALAALALPGRRAAGRTATRWVRLAATGVAAGAVLGAYWLTRAEHPWLLPALAWLLVAAAVLRRQRAGGPRTWRGWLVAAGPVAAGTAIAVAVLAAGIGAVAAQNQRSYGVSLTDNFAGGQFARLYSTWQSVHAGPERRYVPISKAQRLAVYRVSPAAAELEPALEGVEQGFVAGSCQRYRVCDDITAGLIPYAIRNATVRAGRADSEPAAQRYWGLVADQIAAACSDGRLSCGRPMPMMLPSLSQIYVSTFAASAWSSFRWLAIYGPAQTGRSPSAGSARNWALFHQSVNGVPATLPEQQSRERAGLDRARYLVVLRVAYAAGLLVTLLLAVVGYVLALRRRPPGWAPLWILGTAAGLAVAGRVLLLALIDSTSFATARASNYALPAVSFLLIFSVLGAVLLVRCVSRTGRVRGDAPVRPEPIPWVPPTPGRAAAGRTRIVSRITSAGGPGPARPARPW